MELLGAYALGEYYNGYCDLGPLLTLRVNYKSEQVNKKHTIKAFRCKGAIYIMRMNAY